MGRLNQPQIITVPAVTMPGSGATLYCTESTRRRSPGFNEPAKRAKQMRQVINRADAECQASVERSPSPQTPHPRATDAPSRGIKFPISDYAGMMCPGGWFLLF